MIDIAAGIDGNVDQRRPGAGEGIGPDRRQGFARLDPPGPAAEGAGGAGNVDAGIADTAVGALLLLFNKGTPYLIRNFERLAP